MAFEHMWDVEETYEEWYNNTKAIVDDNYSWDRVGKWAFPTKRNESWSEIFFHICEGSWERAVNGDDNAASSMNGNTCHACGEVVPDGYKMIMLLEKL